MGLAIEDRVVSGGAKTEEKGRRPEPNFFLAGAAKSGSTSLAEYLMQHPDVFMTGGDDLGMKEPMHFCVPIPPWQEQYRDVETYLSLFAGAGNRKAIGEGSVAYLAWHGAETRIHDRYPDARIIIVLRNPADRVYSWYTFLCQLGLEPGPSLEQALKDEDRRAADIDLARKSWYWWGSLQYFKFGHYAADIERFLSVFPREQMHFLLSEDLKKQPTETTQAVYKFLGVDSTFVPTFKVYNPTWMPLSIGLQHYVTRKSRLNPVVRRDGPIRFRDRITYPLITSANKLLGTLRKRTFNPETRRELLARYREDIKRTEQLIGRSLDVWR